MFKRKEVGIVKGSKKVFKCFLSASIFCSLLITQMTSVSLGISAEADPEVTDATLISEATPEIVEDIPVEVDDLPEPSPSDVEAVPTVEVEITEEALISSDIVADEVINEAQGTTSTSSTDVTSELVVSATDTAEVPSIAETSTSETTDITDTEISKDYAFLSLYNPDGDMIDNDYFGYNADSDSYEVRKTGYYTRMIVDFSVYTGTLFAEFINESGEVVSRVDNIPTDYRGTDLLKYVFERLDTSALDYILVDSENYPIFNRASISLEDIQTQECYTLPNTLYDYVLYSETGESGINAVIDMDKPEASIGIEFAPHDDLDLRFTCTEKSSSKSKVVLSFVGSIRDGYSINNMFIYKDGKLTNTLIEAFADSPSSVSIDYTFTENGDYRVEFWASNSNIYYFDIKITGIEKSELTDSNDYTAPILRVETSGGSNLSKGTPFKIRALTDEKCTISIGTETFTNTDDATASVYTNGVYKVMATDKSGNTSTEYVTVTAFGDGKLPTDAEVIAPSQGTPADNNPLHDGSNTEDGDIWGKPQINTHTQYTPEQLGYNPNEIKDFEGASVIAQGLANDLKSLEKDKTKDKLPQAGKGAGAVIAGVLAIGTSIYLARRFKTNKTASNTTSSTSSTKDGGKC